MRDWRVVYAVRRCAEKLLQQDMSLKYRQRGVLDGADSLKRYGRPFFDAGRAADLRLPTEYESDYKSQVLDNPAFLYSSRTFSHHPSSSSLRVEGRKGEPTIFESTACVGGSDFESPHWRMSLPSGCR